MDCKIFRNDIAALVERDKNTDELHAHLRECTECAAYYRRTMHVLESLTPKVPVTAQETLLTNVLARISREETTRSGRTGRKFSRPATFIAICTAAAVLAVAALVAIPDATAKERAAAAQVFEQSATCTAPLQSMVMHMDVRTLPRENFEYIDMKEEMVPHTISAILAPSSSWRIDKGGRIAIWDGQKQYMWLPAMKAGCTGGKNVGFVEFFKAFLDPAGLLHHEKELTQSKGGRYKIYETDSAIFLTVTAEPIAKKYKHGYLLNSSIYDSHNRREYVFDKRTHLLKSLQVFIRDNDKETLVLETTGIEYDVPVAENLFVAPAEYEWENVDAVGADGLLTNMSPKEAAETILTAISKGKMQEINSAIGLMSRLGLKMEYNGMKIVRIGEPFQSGEYKGWFVPYEITRPNGSPQKGNMALRNDNPAKTWMLDGGF